MNATRSILRWPAWGAVLLVLASLAAAIPSHAAEKDKKKAPAKPAAKAPAAKGKPKPAAAKAPAKKTPPQPVARPSTAPLKALPAPESSATKVDADQAAASKSQAARLQAGRENAASEQQFLRLLQDKLPVGLWSPDRIASEEDGNTLLHFAVMQGWPDAAKYLVEHGADPGSRNALGKTPAILAKELGHDGILGVLDRAAAVRAAKAASK